VSNARLYPRPGHLWWLAERLSGVSAPGPLHRHQEALCTSHPAGAAWCG